MDFCWLPNADLNECGAFPDKDGDGVGCWRHNETFMECYPHLYTLRARMRKEFKPFPYRDDDMSEDKRRRLALMENIWDTCFGLAMEKPGFAQNDLSMLELYFADIYKNCQALGFRLTMEEEEYFAGLRRRAQELKTANNIQQEANAMAEEVRRRELEVRRQQEAERLRMLALQEAETRKLKAENDMAELTGKLGKNKLDDTPPPSQEDDFVLPARK